MYQYAWSATKDGSTYDLTGVPTDGDTFAFTPTDTGAYVISLTLTDQVGGIGLASAEVVVQEQAGTPTLLLDAGAAAAGQPTTVTLGAGTVDEAITGWALDWGDGTVVTAAEPAAGNDWGQGVVWDPAAGAWQATHTYADGPLTVLVAATASNGQTGFAAVPQVLEVQDPGRVVTLSGVLPVVVGQPLTPTLTIDADTQDAVRSWWINWGDGEVQALTFDPVTGQPTVPSHAYAQSGDYTIRAFAIDSDGHYQASTAVTVTDAAVDLIHDDSYSVPYDTPLYAYLDGLGLLDNDPADPQLDLTITFLHPTDPTKNVQMQPGGDDVTFETQMGRLDIDSAGYFTYTPDAGASGVDAFFYKMVDNWTGDTDYAHVRIVVRADGDNAVPVSNEELLYVGVGQTISVTEPSQGLLGSVLDPDGDAHWITTDLSSFPGLSVDFFSGTFTYTPPDPTFTGDVVIDYDVSDGVTPSSHRLTLRFVNSAPVVQTNVFQAVAQEPITVDAGAGLLALASDADGDTLSVSKVEDEEPDFDNPEQKDTFFLDGGKLEVFEDGAYTFTPDSGFVGDQHFTFTISDGNSGETTSSVTIQVIAGLVTVADDSYIGRAGQLLSVSAETGVLANDVDLLDLPLTVISTQVVTDEFVTVTLASDGSFSYMPPEGFVGDDRFRYTVEDISGNTYDAEVVLYVESEAPIGINDLYIVDLGQKVDFDLLANDIAFADGQPIWVTTDSVGTPEFGTLLPVDVDQGLYQYQAPGDWTGQFTITYTVTDGIETSEPISVEIIVVADGLVAVPDVYETSHGQAITINDTADGLLSNDLGPVEFLTVLNSGIVEIEHGDLLIGPSGLLIYAPDAGFVGEETVEYYLTDGTDAWVQGTVTFVVTNEAPTAPTLRATVDEDSSVVLVLPALDPDPGDAVALTYELVSGPVFGELNTETWTYSPKADFAGTDGFAYLVTDSIGESALGLVEIHVNAVNDPPVVDTSMVTINADDVLSLNLTQYVTDIEGDELVYTLVSGSATVTADGLMTFDPAGVIGTTLLGLEVSDGSSSITFDLTVDAVNTAPEGVADSYGVFAGTTRTVDAGLGVLANDRDDLIDQVLAIGTTTTLTTTQGGSATLNPDGSFSYTPPSGLINGTDSFAYTPDDGHAVGSSTTITLNVSNSQVIASGDRYIAHAGSTLQVTQADQGVLRNDLAATGSLIVTSYTATPPQGSSVTVNTGSTLTTTQGGSVTFNSDGTFDYTAPHDVVEDSFTYTASNGTDSHTMSVYINVRNEAPIAVGDSYEVNAHADAQNPTKLDRMDAGPAGYQGLLVNDYDPDGDVLTVTQFNGQAITADPIVVSDEDGTVQGNFVIHADGGFTFTPAEGYTGLVEASYEVSDGTVHNTAGIEIHVVNTPPTGVADSFRYHHTEVQQGQSGSGHVLVNDYDYDGPTPIALAKPASGLEVDVSGGGVMATTAGGMVTLNADGTFSYQAPDGFVGKDSFQYAAYDKIQSTESLEWVNVSIEVWNRLSLLASDTFYYTHQYSATAGPLTGNVLSNDVQAMDSPGTGYNLAKLVDRDSGEVVAPGTIIQTSRGGEVTMQADGSFAYTPSVDWGDNKLNRTPGGFTGTDSFSYIIEDEVQKTSSATVQLVVNNQAPQAVDDVFMIKQSLEASGDVLQVNGQVLSNDWDAEGDDLALDMSYYGITTETQEILDPDTNEPTGEYVEVVTIPTAKGGEVVLKSDGTFNYTGPNQSKGFDGVDSFNYRLLDGAAHLLTPNAGSITGTVRIYVVNDIIQATDDFFVVQMGGFGPDKIFNLVQNDYLGSADASQFEIEVIADSQKGAGTITPDGHSFTFEPSSTFQHGEVSFRYRLTQKVQVPDPETPGQDIDLVIAWSEATVQLDIQPPLYRAVDVYMTVPKDGVGGSLLANDYKDTPADENAIQQLAEAETDKTTDEGGTVTINRDGTFQYTPPSTEYGIFNGIDSFEYTAGWGDPNDPGVELVGESTAKVIIAYGGVVPTETPVSDTVKSTGEVFQAGGADQTLSIQAILGLFYSQEAIDNELDVGTFEIIAQPWLAIADEHGGDVRIEHVGDGLSLTSSVSDALTFTIANYDGLSRDLTVTWQVSPPALSVSDDVAVAQAGQMISIDVLANDGIQTQHGEFETAATLAPSDQIRISTSPSNGYAVFNGYQLEYTPDAGFFGKDTLTYEITSGTNTYSGSVDVHVAPPIDQPIQAVDDTLEEIGLGAGSYGSITGFDLTANDTDTDEAGGVAAPTRAYVTAQGQYGYASITLSSGSALLDYHVYKRPAATSVTDRVSYAIEDQWGNVSEADVTVQITTDPVPDDPVNTPYPSTIGDTPLGTVTLSAGASLTSYHGDHLIRVSSTHGSGEVGLSFSANSLVVNSAGDDAQLVVVREGHVQGKLSVAWNNANPTNSLAVVNHYGTVAGTVFGGDLTVNATSDLAEDFSANSLTIYAGYGSSVSGTHHATGTAADDDLIIQNAHHVGGSLTADSGSVILQDGSGAKITGNVNATISAGQDIDVLVDDGDNQSVRGTMTAQGSVAIDGGHLIHANVTYGGGLTLTAGHGDIGGAYTSTAANGGFATVDALNLAATFTNVSQDSTFEADYDISGRIQGDQVQLVRTHYGSVSATLDVDNLEKLKTGLDFTGRATGTGMLESLAIGRDLSGTIDYHTINRLPSPSGNFFVGRDFTSTGTIKVGAGGLLAGEFIVGRNFSGTLISEDAMDADLTAGLDLNGAVTALNATSLIHLKAGRSIGMNFNAPGIYLNKVVAGDEGVDDRYARGSMKNAQLITSGIGDLEVHAGWGITDDNAGKIVGGKITLHAEQLEASHGDDLGATAWALGRISTTGAIEGLEIQIHRASASDQSIEQVTTGTRADGASSLSIVTEGTIGTITAERGDLTLSQLNAAKLGTISTKQGGLDVVSGAVIYGIDALTVCGDFEGFIVVQEGNLGDYNASSPVPSIMVGGGINADLTVVQGDVGRIVAGLITAGGVAGSIWAEQGVVWGVESRGGIDTPFSSDANGDPVTARNAVTKGKDFEIPEWYIVPLDEVLQPPEALYKPDYTAAGNISSDISAMSIGSVHTMGDLSGSLTAFETIDDVWVFGDITDQAKILSEVGSISVSTWGDANAEAIKAKGDIELNVRGSLGSKVVSSNGSIRFNAWEAVSSEADLSAKNDVAGWGMGTMSANSVAADEGEATLKTWGSLTGTSFKTQQASLLSYGSMSGNEIVADNALASLYSGSMGSQDWGYNGALKEHVAVSATDFSITAGDHQGQDLLYAVVGGDLTINGGTLRLNDSEQRYASATLLVKGDLTGSITVKSEAGDELSGSIKTDVGSIHADSKLSAESLVLASNGNAAGEHEATLYLGLDAQGAVSGKYAASKGSVQILAGQSANVEEVRGQLHASVNARGSVSGTIISDGGAVAVESHNSHDGSAAGVHAEIYGYSQAYVNSFGTTEIKLADGYTRITEGGLEVFSIGDINNGSILTAGGDVGVEVWGSMAGFVDAGVDDVADSEHYSAAVIAHDDISGTIYASGDIQAVALNNHSGIMESFFGSVSAQAGGELSNSVIAQSDIDLIARTISSPRVESFNGNISAIALTDASYQDVHAKGDIQLIAGQNLSVTNHVKAKGETDGQGVPTLRPDVALIADQGTLSATAIVGHGDLSTYAGTTASLTTQADGPIGTPRSVSLVAQGDVIGSLIAQESVSVMALNADSDSAQPAGPADIALSSVQATAANGSVYLFADGAIGNASFTASAGNTLIASANGPVKGAYTAGAGGVSLSSLAHIDANATTSDGSGGAISLFAGGKTNEDGADLTTYTIAGSVDADGSADLFAAGKITADVTAGDSASVSALTGDVKGDLTTESANGTLAIFTGIVIPEKVEVDGQGNEILIPAYNEGGNVSGTINAAGDLSLLALEDLTGATSAGGDAELLILGDQAATVTAGGALSLYANDVSASIAAGLAASVTSATDIAGNITAGTGLTALAGNAISHTHATTTGNLEAIALTNLTGQLTAHDGDVSIIVGGTFDATVAAHHNTTGGNVDALAMSGFQGVINADAEANLTALGNSSGTINASLNVVANPAALSTITVIGDGNSSGDVSGAITAQYGSVALTASGDLSAAVDAGAANDATAGSADVTLAGGVTASGSVSAYLDATLLAFKPVLGDITADTGDASVTTADALSNITITAGTDATASAIKESAVTITAGNDIELALSASSTDIHTIDLDAGGKIDANVIGDMSGPIAAGGNANVFVLGSILGSANMDAGGTLELLASSAMTLGAVTGGQGVELSTPGSITATSVASSAGSVSLFAGDALSFGGGAVTAQEDLTLSTRGVITAGGLAATSGSISVATQSGFGIDSDAGNNLAVFALGSITHAAYTAGGNVVLVSLSDIVNNTGSIDTGEELRLLARGDIDASSVSADVISLLHAEGDVSGTYSATTEIDRVIVHGDMTGTLTEALATYTYDDPSQPGVEPLTWTVHNQGIYSLDRVRADLTSLDESLLSLIEQINSAWVGSTEQQGATAADLTKAEADLIAALAEAVASANDSFASMEQGVTGAVSDTQDAFVRVAGETAIALSRGVTDADAALGDLTMQVLDQAIRSKETLTQASGGLATLISQLSEARTKNEELFGRNHAASQQSRTEGIAFRNHSFDHAARAAISSIEEIARERRLDELQERLAWLGMIPVVGVVFDLTNASISLARGNYQDAALHTAFALPIVGMVAGVGLMGYAVGQSLVDPQVASSAAKQDITQLPIRRQVSWVSGGGSSNSFVAGTGVVTGVDEYGNPITTNIEDLEVGDVVLAGNELDPSDPNHYALVTGTSHRTVYELTEVTYVDDTGNIEVIKATDSHEFYVEGLGWVKAVELQQGNRLTLSDGRTAMVAGTRTLDVLEGVEVYNLSVTDGKTYFVDDGQGEVSAAWVHNRTKFISRLNRNDGALYKVLGKRKAGYTAHHLVPISSARAYGLRTFFIKAAKAGWDINGKRNGLMINRFTRHMNAHPLYNTYIEQRIKNYIKKNGGVHQINGSQARKYLESLSDDMSRFIQKTDGDLNKLFT